MIVVVTVVPRQVMTVFKMLVVVSVFVMMMMMTMMSVRVLTSVRRDAPFGGTFKSLPNHQTLHALVRRVN